MPIVIKKKQQQAEVMFCSKIEDTYCVEIVISLSRDMEYCFRPRPLLI